MFFPAIFIPVCASSSPAFCMMYSAYKLNKQSDNIQPWCTLFLIWNQSDVPCPVLTVASWHAHRFLRRQVMWSGITISWKIFHSLYFWKSSEYIQHLQVSFLVISTFLVWSLSFSSFQLGLKFLSTSSAWYPEMPFWCWPPGLTCVGLHRHGPQKDYPHFKHQPHF